MSFIAINLSPTCRAPFEEEPFEEPFEAAFEAANGESTKIDNNFGVLPDVFNLCIDNPTKLVVPVVPVGTSTETCIVTHFLPFRQRGRGR